MGGESRPGSRVGGRVSAARRRGDAKEPAPRVTRAPASGPAVHMLLLPHKLLQAHADQNSKGPHLKNLPQELLSGRRVPRRRRLGAQKLLPRRRELPHRRAALEERLQL